jgi:hypothetical protein
LGWERIIMLYNKSFGSFPGDLPFDLDKKRVRTYIIKDKDDKSGKGSLMSTLKQDIDVILKANPVKPTQALAKSREQIHRERDIINIENIFGQIDISAIDSFIESLPEKITDSAFHYLYSFKSIYASNTFFVYDIDVRLQLEKFDELWTRTLSYGSYFSENSIGEIIFYIPGDNFPSDVARQAFQKLTKEAFELEDIFKCLIKSIREQYHEIDIDKLSADAAAAYKLKKENSIFGNTYDTQPT